MTKVIDIDMTNFEAEIRSFTGIVVIDFWADWCGPCKHLAGVIDELAAELSDQVKVCKIDVDDNQMLAQSFQVMSVPTVILLKNGETLNRLVGLHDKKVYLDLIKAL